MIDLLKCPLEQHLEGIGQILRDVGSFYYYLLVDEGFAHMIHQCRWSGTMSSLPDTIQSIK